MMSTVDVYQNSVYGVETLAISKFDFPITLHFPAHVPELQQISRRRYFASKNVNNYCLRSFLQKYERSYFCGLGSSLGAAMHRYR